LAEETVWISSQEGLQIREDSFKTLGAGQYMTNREISRAIINIRLHAPKVLFIAVAAAVTIIDKWCTSKNWRDFSIMFRSESVMETKPDGVIILSHVIVMPRVLFGQEWTKYLVNVTIIYPHLVNLLVQINHFLPFVKCEHDFGLYNVNMPRSQEWHLLMYW